MVEQTPDDTEEGASGTASTPADRHSLKEKMEFLRGARRQLSADELSSPIVSRFLIEEIEQMDAEVEALKQFQEDFYKTDKELAVLRQERGYIQSTNIRDATVLAVGSAGIGGAPSYIQISPLGWVFFGLSLVLVTMSFVKKKS